MTSTKNITAAAVAVLALAFTSSARAAEDNTEVKSAAFLAAYLRYCGTGISADRAEFVGWLIGSTQHEYGDDRVQAEIVRLLTELKVRADKDDRFIPFLCDDLQKRVDRTYDPNWKSKLLAPKD